MLDSWIYKYFINTVFFVIFVFLLTGVMSALIIYHSGKSSDS